MDKMDAVDAFKRLEALARNRTPAETAARCKRLRECGTRPINLPPDWTRTRQIVEEEQRNLHRIGTQLADMIEQVDRLIAHLERS